MNELTVNLICRLWLWRGSFWRHARRRRGEFLISQRKKV